MANRYHGPWYKCNEGEGPKVVESVSLRALLICCLFDS